MSDRLLRTIGDITRGSPIEQRFSLAWEIFAWRWHSQYDRVFPGVLIHEYPVKVEGRQYRVDFRVGVEDEDGKVYLLPFVIELEGHEYHERTKAKVIEDNERERALGRAGLFMVRFSGAEVHHYAAQCVDEALNTIEAIGPRLESSIALEVYPEVHPGARDVGQA